MRFARAKATVCVWDLPSQQGGMDETVALARKDGGKCSAFPVDVTNIAMVKVPDTAVWLIVVSYASNGCGGGQ